VAVRIDYVYNALYLAPSENPLYASRYNALFGHFSYFGAPASTNPARTEISLSQIVHLSIGGIGAFDARGEGLGGWTLDVHHTYAPVGHTLYLGDGTQRGGHNGDASTSLQINTAAGNGTPGGGGDGGPATAAQLHGPSAVAVGPDGSLYIADTLNNRVRRVTPDGAISTVAGAGSAGYGGDNGPATAAQLDGPAGLAVGPDGSLYIADTRNNRVRRISPDGVIDTVAGDGTAGGGGDGGTALQAQLHEPAGLAVGPDGAIYIADTQNNRVRLVRSDGSIATVSGGSSGIPDTVNNSVRRVGPDSSIGAPVPTGVALGLDGSLYIAYSDDGQVRRVTTDGTIVTLAGTSVGFSGDGGTPAAAQLGDQLGVGTEPDGNLAIADAANERVRRVASTLPGLSITESSITSSDGGQIYVFNSAGRHLRTIDAVTGLVLYRFGYDASGHLVSVTDRNGNVTTIQRDDSGNATAIVGPYGQVTSLTLDANGFLTGVTDPLSQTTSMTYTADGLLTGVTDPRGGSYHFGYDAQGRLVRDQLPTGGAYTLARSDGAAAGARDRYAVTLTSPMGHTSTYDVQDFADGGQQRVNTGPDGLRHSALLRADGSSTQMEPNGTIINSVLGPDPRFGTQAPVSTLSSLTMPGGGVSRQVYTQTLALADPANPLSVTDVTDTVTLDGHTASSVYDSATRTSTSTSPQGRTRATLYDGQNRVIQQQIPGSAPLRYTYDSRGRLSTIVQATRVYTFTYDDQGYLAGVTDPLGRTERFAHAAAGQITVQTLPDGRQVGYTYDATGNLTSLTPPGRAAHTFTYNALDALQDYTPPALAAGPAITATHDTYNAEGQLTSVSLADGSTIGLGYDSAGRQSTVATASGQTTYSYDPATGRLSAITAPDGGTVSYGYDGSQTTLVSATGVATGSVGYSYDNSLRLASESVDGGSTVGYGYDQDGLLTQAGALSLGPDPQSGQPISSTLGVVADTQGYDSFGKLSSYSAQAGPTGLFSATYTNDALGRIVRKTETISGIAHTYDYSYDVAGRLVAVTRDGSPVAQYGYDANDNRTSLTTPASGTVTSTYDAQDHLAQVGPITYTYTANGNVQRTTDTTTGASTAYAYDGLGNLMRAILPDGTRIDYTVDGLNRRIGKRVNGVPVQGFVYGLNPLRPAAELDGAGNAVSRFVYAHLSGAPDYMIKGGVTYRIISDNLGNPRLVVDVATGQVVQEMDYDAFGAVITDTNPGFQPFGFAGGLFDRQTGLVHFGARDYDPDTGRWTARDPMLFSGGQTNLYIYANNDPVNRRDPNGLGGQGPMLAGINPFAVAAIAAVFKTPTQSQPPPQSLPQMLAQLEQRAQQGAQQVRSIANSAVASVRMSEGASLNQISSNFANARTAAQQVVQQIGQEVQTDLPALGEALVESGQQVAAGAQVLATEATVLAEEAGPIGAVAVPVAIALSPVGI